VALQDLDTAAQWRWESAERASELELQPFGVNSLEVLVLLAEDGTVEERGRVGNCLQPISWHAGAV